MREKGDNFPFVDSLIICSARENSVKIITTDNHFKPFKEAVLL